MGGAAARELWQCWCVCASGCFAGLYARERLGTNQPALGSFFPSSLKPASRLRCCRKQESWQRGRALSNLFLPSALEPHAEEEGDGEEEEQEGLSEPPQQQQRERQQR